MTSGLWPRPSWAIILALIILSAATILFIQAIA